MMWRECVRKEWMESLKTARFWVVMAVSGALGMLSPLTARYINEILTSIGGDFGGIIQLPPAVVNDSWLQFFKNMNQLCMLVMVLMFMNMMSGEKRRGSVLLVLSKGVGRTAFLSAKLVSALIVYTIAYAIALGLHLAYTQVLFGEIGGSGMWIGLFAFWCYGGCVLALTLLMSTLARGTGIAAFLSLGGFFALQLFAIFAKLEAYSDKLLPRLSMFTPGAANGLALLILEGARKPIDGWISAGVSIIMGAVLFLITDLVFKKQEL